MATCGPRQRKELIPNSQLLISTYLVSLSPKMRSLGFKRYFDTKVGTIAYKIKLLMRITDWGGGVLARHGGHGSGFKIV